MASRRITVKFNVSIISGLRIRIANLFFKLLTCVLYIVRVITDLDPTFAKWYVSCVCVFVDKSVTINRLAAIINRPAAGETDELLRRWRAAARGSVIGHCHWQSSWRWFEDTLRGRFVYTANTAFCVSIIVLWDYTLAQRGMAGVSPPRRLPYTVSFA